MNIVVLDGYTLNPGDLSWSSLKELGNVSIYDRTPQDQVLCRAKDADIVLTNKTPLRADVMKKLPRLKYIGVLATGYDVVDIKAAQEQGLIVSNVPAYGTDSVAQLVIALLLELCHQAGEHSRSVRAGQWSASEDWCYWNSPLVELSGKTMGILGLGRIGTRVAQVANALGMDIIAVSHSKRWELPIEGFRWVTQQQLFERSDVISLHCPLTEQTEGIINGDNLSIMKSTSFLINTARGKLVKEEDLATALNAGQIAGAAMDVLCEEPPKHGSPLMKAKNCIITPHLAWASQEARGRLLKTAIGNIKAYLKDCPENVVTR